MNIGPGTVAALDIELQDLWGNVLQKTEEPLLYLHGGAEGLLPALEQALAGRAEGDRLEVRLEPEDAFGDYDETLLRVEPRGKFPESVAVGMQFEGIPGEAGDETIYTVTDVADDAVVLDGNHPLAGMALKFLIHVASVRPATADEIERGSAADAGSLLLRILP
ncbi:MAG: peptidylprolyl isomerase [Burkholderiales bacterium]|nr:peptidylprolyl isomerase [Burkholderiales bacterium]